MTAVGVTLATPLAEGEDYTSTLTPLPGHVPATPKADPQPR